MPGMDGLELLAHDRARDPSLPVILLTAHGSRARRGRGDEARRLRLPRPSRSTSTRSRVVIERALEARRLRVDNRRLAAEQTLGRRIIGDSAADAPPARGHRRASPRATSPCSCAARPAPARSSSPSCSTRSRRARRSRSSASTAPPSPPSSPRPSCSATPSGAFTGATAARPGFFAQADGGTLILDEVGELPPAVQAKLLRALQEGEIQPVGSGRIEKVDVRVVACDQPRPRRRRQGRHASARTSTTGSRSSSSSCRRCAIARTTSRALADEFARRYGDKFGLGTVALEPALIDALARADWPGNVRQLENTIARLAALSAGGVIGLADYQRPPAATRRAAPALEARRRRRADARDRRAQRPSLKEQVEAFERGLVARALDATGGNQSEAARRLGVSARHADRQDEEVRARRRGRRRRRLQACRAKARHIKIARRRRARVGWGPQKTAFFGAGRRVPPRDDQGLGAFRAFARQAPSRAFSPPRRSPCRSASYR